MDHGSSSTALQAWIMYSFGLVRQAHLGGSLQKVDFQMLEVGHQHSKLKY